MSLVTRRQMVSFLGASAASMTFPFSRGRASDWDGKRPIRVGIPSGEDEDVWRAVTANAAREGITVHPIPFLSGDMINVATAEHDLDANAFQHGPFLQAQNEAHHFDIVPVGDTYFAPIGLYSRRWKKLEDIPEGAVIGIPSDPSDEGRALNLLASQGLLTLSVSSLLASVVDIKDNPKNITIRELEDGIVARSLPDLDAAVIVTEWAFKSGVDIKRELLARESMVHNPYINFIATNREDSHALWVAPLVRAFQQPNIRQILMTAYGGAIVPAWS